MFKLMKKRLKNEKGLTLVEVLAVVVILAIIAAIAIPAIGNIIDNSRAKALVSDSINVMSAANIYFTENSDDPSVTDAELKSGKYLESIGKLTEGSIIVTNTAGEELKISAKGKNGNVNFSISDLTLQQLSDAKVSVDDDNNVELKDETGKVINDSSTGGDGGGEGNNP